MRHDDWLALSQDELDALTADSVETPLDAPCSDADPLVEPPAGLAWEDLGRALLEKRKHEAAVAVLLLDAARAAEDDALASGLRRSSCATARADFRAADARPRGRTSTIRTSGTTAEIPRSTTSPTSAAGIA